MWCNDDDDKKSSSPLCGNDILNLIILNVVVRCSLFTLLFFYSEFHFACRVFFVQWKNFVFVFHQNWTRIKKKKRIYNVTTYKKQNRMADDGI